MAWPVRKKLASASSGIGSSARVSGQAIQRPSAVGTTRSVAAETSSSDTDAATSRLGAATRAKAWVAPSVRQISQVAPSRP